MRNSRNKHALSYTVLIIWAVIQLFPLYYLFTFSLKSNEEILGKNIIGLPAKWLWSNYQKVLNESNIVRYFANSVVVTAITIFAVIIISVMSAYALYCSNFYLSFMLE